MSGLVWSPASPSSRARRSRPTSAPTYPGGGVLMRLPVARCLATGERGNRAVHVVANASAQLSLWSARPSGACSPRCSSVRSPRPVRSARRVRRARRPLRAALKESSSSRTWATAANPMGFPAKPASPVPASCSIASFHSAVRTSFGSPRNNRPSPTHEPNKRRTRPSICRCRIAARTSWPDICQRRSGRPTLPARPTRRTMNPSMPAAPPMPSPGRRPI